MEWADDWAQQQAPALAVDKLHIRFTDVRGPVNLECCSSDVMEWVNKKYEGVRQVFCLSLEMVTWTADGTWVPCQGFTRAAVDTLVTGRKRGG